jgi:hypothetical protein
MRRDGPEFPARFVFAFGAVRAFQFRHPASSVIPAEAGIHCDFILRAAEKAKWIPAFAGMTGWRPSPK